MKYKRKSTLFSRLYEIFGLAVALISLFASSNSMAQIDLSSMEFEQEIYKEPFLTYQEILKKPKTADDKDYLFWLLRKSQCEYLLYFYDDFTGSIETLSKIVNDDSPILIQSHLNFYQGVIYRDKGQYNKATYHFDLALEQSKKAQLDYVYVQVKHEKAYTQSLAELFEISLKDMQEAHTKAHEINDEFLIASINETYGAIYGYMHDYKKSIEYYEKSLEIYNKLGFKAHRAEAIYGLASTYRYWKKYDLAIEYFEKYREISQYTPNDEISFYAAYGLGMSLSEKGDCEKAVKMIDEALMKKGIIDYNTELYKNKAVCLIQLGQIDEATKSLNKAIEIFKQLPDLKGTSWQLETIKIQSQIELAKKQYQLSYQLLEEYYQKFTELLLKNSSDRLLDVRTELEKDRKEIEKDLELQRKQVASLKEQALKQKHTQQLYFLLFVIVIILVIVIVQQLSNKKMRKLSFTDPLSGLFNRRYVFTFVNKILSTMSPNKGQLSLILFDIDDFKNINDQYGHPVGDFVIKEIAEIGKKELRGSDIYARIGGEEFLCVLPRTSKTQALEVAQRLLESVSQYSFRYPNTEIIKLTISIGIADYSQNSQTYNEIYTLADNALYKAKSQGKNCIVVSE